MMLIASLLLFATGMALVTASTMRGEFRRGYGRGYDKGYLEGLHDGGQGRTPDGRQG